MDAETDAEARMNPDELAQYERLIGQNQPAGDWEGLHQEESEEVDEDR